MTDALGADAALVFRGSHAIPSNLDIEVTIS